MASNILSRILPTNHTGRSIYEDLRAHDDGFGSDIEGHVGLAIDEENFGFHDEDLAHAYEFNEEDSRMTTESTGFLAQKHGQPRSENNPTEKSHDMRSKWIAQSPRLLGDDGDDDVPASLLIETNDTSGPSTSNASRSKNLKFIKRALPIPGILNKESLENWEAAQVQQKLHRGGVAPVRRNTGLLRGSAREKALWRWINVTNLDNFIREVYDYYTGAGIWCILLDEGLSLVQRVFVAVFTTFLSQCVNYQAIPTSKSLSEALVPQCTKKMSGFSNVAIWLFTLHVFWRLYQILADIPRLMRIRDFYSYLLQIPESDMQTISWQHVVARIMALRDANPVTADRISPANRKYIGSQSKQRLDAHDIANRLMRQENYLIALFNKDILDLTLPVPFLQGRQFFSRALLWNINQCIMDLVFDEQGQVRQLILKESHRRQLSNALQGRFLFAGVMNAILAPIIVVYLMIVYFLRYFNEYQKNPAAVGSRQYTPLAEWKFREFNELQHLFEKRLNMSYPFASRYLDQFPKVKMTQLARFAAFVAGALVSVLAVATLWEPEMLTTLEITTDRPVVFYLGVFGAIWALTNGMIPEENLVFEPEYALRNVIDYTHYMPNHWNNRLHSDEVKREFATLYQLKIFIFLEEVFSIIITPFILWFSLPKTSDQIIDFFREFTIHVDGVGYVCSFAVFDFKKGGGRKPPTTGGSADVRDDYYATKHGKMAASYYGFIDNYLVNPKTAVQGHVPPGIHHQHIPPPTFPGLMSPKLAANMHNSRLGRSERRPGSRARNLIPQTGRTPRFTPANTCNISPTQSVLLDPHHQPSRQNSHSRYQASHNIVEEPMEDVDESRGGRPKSESDPYESTVGLEESRWETSPTRARGKEVEYEESEDTATAGVLGMLYQFQKAQKDGRGGVSI